MNLCFSGYVLLAGLFLSVSALTPEECQPLVKPLSLADMDVSSLNGRYNWVLGNTDNKAMNEILKVTDSSWVTLSASKDNPKEVIMSEHNKLKGQCFRSRFSMLMDGDVFRMSLTNWSSVLHMLPSSEGCITFSANNTASGFDMFFHMLNISSPIGGEAFNSHALYLLCGEETVNDSAVEHFKQQAICFGFSGELYIYDPKKGFCSEGEGLMLEF